MKGQPVTPGLVLIVDAVEAVDNVVDDPDMVELEDEVVLIVEVLDELLVLVLVLVEVVVVVDVEVEVEVVEVLDECFSKIVSSVG